MDISQDVKVTQDNGYIITGKTSSKLSLIKLASDPSAKAPAAEAKTVKQLTVSSVKVTLKAGQKQQVKVTALYTDGTKEDVTAKAAWTSKKTAVAAVSKGLITAGKTKGTTIVTASFGGKSGSVNITVK